MPMRMQARGLAALVVCFRRIEEGLGVISLLVCWIVVLVSQRGTHAPPSLCGLCAGSRKNRRASDRWSLPVVPGHPSMIHPSGGRAWCWDRRAGAWVHHRHSTSTAACFYPMRCPKLMPQSPDKQSKFNEERFQVSAAQIRAIA